ncbi:hypothetical protein EVAR_29509_1 [Eumeta japonica]|uniref:Uncharacterized protein n=1 Tax=Eumeta variegata TaxID=151549 RepID=A0A4C1WEQ7_EUMVA|nr:hypothetical protein EVAR_29509_1 [Eumeta japonica]
MSGTQLKREDVMQNDATTRRRRKFFTRIPSGGVASFGRSGKKRTEKICTVNKKNGRALSKYTSRDYRCVARGAQRALSAKRFIDRGVRAAAAIVC